MEFEGLPHKRRMPTLTPLIDIVFLLLVFFLLTAHFVKDEALDISLPEADSSVVIEDKGMLEIVLDNQGHILIDKEYVAVTELEKVLQQQLRDRKNKQVILRGDKIAKLGLTVSVMDAARKAGAISLDIVTQNP